jgi:hypothetical protein
MPISRSAIRSPRLVESTPASQRCWYLRCLGRGVAYLPKTAVGLQGLAMARLTGGGCSVRRQAGHGLGVAAPAVTQPRCRRRRWSRAAVTLQMTVANAPQPHQLEPTRRPSGHRPVASQLPGACNAVDAANTQPGPKRLTRTQDTLPMPASLSLGKMSPMRTAHILPCRYSLATRLRAHGANGPSFHPQARVKTPEDLVDVLAYYARHTCTF